MRTPHQILHTLALITVVLAFSFLVTNVCAQVPCATPLAHGQTSTWKQNTSVNVMIDPTFSPAQQQVIKDQFNKWKNAGGANITFNFVEPSQAGGGATTGGPPIVSVIRQVPTEKGPTAQGETDGFAYNGYRGDTSIDINPGVTDPTAFTHVMSHEIGHTFGLKDCEDCAAGSSAMTVPPAGSTLNAAGGYDGPTPCDSNKVASNGNYSPPPPPEEFGGGSCPGVECNEGSGFPPDNCAWSGGCPSGWVNTGQCCQPFILSPIVIDVDGSGFDMTAADQGVAFDFFGIKKSLRLSWIAQDSTNAFLVLDRDGNGTIDSGRELFGNITPQPKSSEPNGFLALAEYDKAANGGNSDGGNSDGVIDHNDAIFLLLRLWQDENHNGFSEWWELHTLADLNVESISLDFRESRRVDRYGNQFRYRAKITDSKGAQLGRWAWDVFLVAQ